MLSVFSCFNFLVAAAGRAGGSGIAGISIAMVGPGVGSTIATVPEPSALLCVGLVGLGVVGWQQLRKNRRAS